MRNKFKVQNSKFKVTIQNAKFLIFTLLFCTLIFTLLTLPLTPTFASHNPCHNTTVNARTNGLFSTPILGGIFNSSTGEGVCVIDPAARLGPFVFGTGDIYDNLKAKFYDAAKDNPTLLINKNNALPGPDPYNQTNIPIGTTEDQLYYIQASLNLTGAPTGNRTGVVLIDGNLTIGPIAGNQLVYGTNSSGLVLVVKGNVNIDPTITRVDAVIISTGTIDTGMASSQLVINGSLVSLNPALPIQFRRDLGGPNSTIPAEKVNFQPKYLVILRDLFSQTDQRWSEVAGRVNVPAPATPVPTPTPIPPPCPTGFRDEDLDTFTVGGPQTVCPGPGLPSGWRSTASAQPDCYDKNNQAFPGQITYFNTTRGTAAQGNDSTGNTWNSFDYDCDGSATKGLNNCLTTMSASSCSNTILPGNAGFIGPTTPACGQTDYFRTCTSFADASCVAGPDRPFSCGVTCTASGRSSWQVGEWIAVMFMDCR